MISVLHEDIRDLHMKGPVCITTNGTVTEYDGNIMGAGTAGWARARYPGIEYIWGETMQKYGLHVYFDPARGLINFPVKHTIDQPASKTLIIKSLLELQKLEFVYDWSVVYLPKPGCGAGGLKWEGEDGVEKLCEKWIGDKSRIQIVDRPRVVMGIPAQFG